MPSTSGYTSVPPPSSPPPPPLYPLRHPPSPQPPSSRTRSRHLRAFTLAETILPIRTRLQSLRKHRRSASDGTSISLPHANSGASRPLADDSDIDTSSPSAPHVSIIESVNSQNNAVIHDAELLPPSLMPTRVGSLAASTRTMAHRQPANSSSSSNPHHAPRANRRLNFSSAAQAQASTSSTASSLQESNNFNNVTRPPGPPERTSSRITATSAAATAAASSSSTTAGPSLDHATASSPAGMPAPRRTLFSHRLNAAAAAAGKRPTSSSTNASTATTLMLGPEDNAAAAAAAAAASIGGRGTAAPLQRIGSLQGRDRGRDRERELQLQQQQQQLLQQQQQQRAERERELEREREVVARDEHGKYILDALAGLEMPLPVVLANSGVAGMAPDPAAAENNRLIVEAFRKHEGLIDQSELRATLQVSLLAKVSSLEDDRWMYEGEDTGAG